MTCRPSSYLEDLVQAAAKKGRRGGREGVGGEVLNSSGGTKTDKYVGACTVLSVDGKQKAVRVS